VNCTIKSQAHHQLQPVHKYPFIELRAMANKKSYAHLLKGPVRAGLYELDISVPTTPDWQEERLCNLNGGMLTGFEQV
jgi:hypothetical protein